MSNEPAAGSAAVSGTPAGLKVGPTESAAHCDAIASVSASSFASGTAISCRAYPEPGAGGMFFRSTVSVTGSSGERWKKRNFPFGYSIPRSAKVSA